MMGTMNDGLYDDQKFNIDYKRVDNYFKLEIIDLRHVAEQYGDDAIVNLFSDEDLQTTKWNNAPLNKSESCSMNQIMILTKTAQIKHTP
jgi:hypothetical protein